MNEQRQSVSYDEDVIDLRALFKVLFKRKWIIIGGTLLAVLMAAIVSFVFLRPVYEAYSLLRVTHAVGSIQSSTRDSADGLEDIVDSMTRIPQITMQTHVGQIQSEAMKQRVQARLSQEMGYNGPVSFSGTMVTDSNLIELKVQHTDPVLAALIANAASEEYIKFISEMNREQMNLSVVFLQEQYDAARADRNAARDLLNNELDHTERERLQREIERLESTMDLLADKMTETRIARSIDLGQTSVLVVSPASTPDKPVSPNTNLNMALAFVLGLMVCTGLAFVLEHLDYTIKTAEDVDAHLGLPVLGAIPDANAKARRRSYY